METLSRQAIYLQFQFWRVLASSCKSTSYSTRSFSCCWGSPWIRTTRWVAGCSP